MTEKDENKLTIFADNTCIRCLSNKVIEIGLEKGIIIRITPARTKDFNAIGYGSAFAYLG